MHVMKLLPHKPHNVANRNLSKEHSARILDVFLHLDQEGRCLPPINQTMIIGESNIHHWPYFNLAVDWHAAVKDGM
jgi:hypothetical protein